MAEGVGPAPVEHRVSAAETAVRQAAFWLFILAGLGLAAAAALARPLAAERAQRERLEFVRAVNARVADANARLADEVEAGKNDPFYAERLVRTDLARRRDGDRVVRVAPPPPDPLADRPPVVVVRLTWWEQAVERLARTPRQRLIAAVTAGLLVLIALVCFAFRGPRS